MTAPSRTVDSTRRRTLRRVAFISTVMLPASLPASLAAQEQSGEGRGRSLPFGRGIFGDGSTRDSTRARRSEEGQRRFAATMVLSAGSNYESNVRFLVPATRTAGAGDPAAARPLGDQYRQASADLSAQLRGRRQQVQVEARGDVARFVTLRELDRETWDIGGQFIRRWSPRVSSLTGARTVTSTGIVGAVTATPGLLPLALTHTESAVHSVVIQHSPRTQLTTTLDASRVRFDERALAGGTTIGAQLQARTQRSTRSTRALLFDVRHVEFERRPIGTVLMEGEWQQPLARGTWTLRVGATGVGPQPRRPGARWGDSVRVEPSGALVFETPLGRDALAVRLAREVRAGFGFGRPLLSDVAALAFTRLRALGGSLTMALDASRNVDPFDARLQLRAYGATADFRRTVGPAAVAVTGFARRRSESVDVDNVGASVQVRLAVGRAP